MFSEQNFKFNDHFFICVSFVKLVVRFVLCKTPYLAMLVFYFYLSLTQCKISINWAINLKMQTNKIEKETQPQHTLTVSPQYPLTTQKKKLKKMKRTKIFLCAEQMKLRCLRLFFFSTTPWNCGNFIASTVCSIPHIPDNITDTSAKKKMHAIDTKKRTRSSAHGAQNSIMIIVFILFIIIRA